MYRLEATLQFQIHVNNIGLDLIACMVLIKTQTHTHRFRQYLLVKCIRIILISRQPWQCGPNSLTVSKSKISFFTIKISII